jgi:hypothetical protein
MARLRNAPNERDLIYRKDRPVTHACCPNCRLRFTPAASAYIAACPECGEPPQPSSGLEGVIGFRLFRLEDLPHSLPEAIAVSIPILDRGAERSPSGRVY